MTTTIQVLITNRLAHSELLTTLLRDNDKYANTVRNAWEQRREVWRQLRHTTAIACKSYSLHTYTYTQ
jgi:hypothetical protein